MTEHHGFKGWKCKIQHLHEGPCPLVPTLWTRFKYLLKGRRFPF